MINLKRSLLAVALMSVAGWQVSAQEMPLKVFLLVGQSNMQGHAHIRTLAHLGMDEKTKPILDEILEQNGEPKVFNDVWVSYLSSNGVKSGQLSSGYGADEFKFGPELTFGIYMQKRLNEPILIIKTAWGGKSINTDFRPPSAGAYEFEKSVLDRLEAQGKDIEKVKVDKRIATGVFYRQSVDHIKHVLGDIKSVYPNYDQDHGFEFAGLVWFQGWNDMVDGGTYPRRGEDGGYDEYSTVLAHMIRDFRKDLSAPKLPFVIGVMGVNGPTDKYSEQQLRYKKIHQSFRDAMAAPADIEEFKSNVVAVLTESYWDMELDSIVVGDAEFKSRIRSLVREENWEELTLYLAQSKNSAEQDIQTVEQLKQGGKFAKAAIEKLADQQLSARERRILAGGKSNAAFHYFGSAKIMARIGKAFAESMPLKE